MQFDESAFLEEMLLLVQAAKNRMKLEHPDVEIFSINIWTNPDAARSAVSFDTFENSLAKLEQQNQWNKKHYDRLLAERDTEQAKLFLPSAERLYNPANFAFREIEIIENRSFRKNWRDESEGKCWQVLEPALLRVHEIAKPILADLKLHPQAELSVNSQWDWYDYAEPMWASTSTTDH